MQVFPEPRRVGKPRTLPIGAKGVEGRFSAEELARIDAYRERHGAMSRSQAVRQLVLLALEQEVTDTVTDTRAPETPQRRVQEQ